MASIESVAAKRLFSELIKRAQSHTSDLRLNALEAGWPIELVQSMSIRVTPEGNYKDYHPKALHNLYLKYEQGDEDTPPNPVVHNFMIRLGHGAK